VDINTLTKPDLIKLLVETAVRYERTWDKSAHLGRVTGILSPLHTPELEWGKYFRRTQKSLPRFEIDAHVGDILCLRDTRKTIGKGLRTYWEGLWFVVLTGGHPYPVSMDLARELFEIRALEG
jgi:hypothetical protein